jgi:hypothetical protein
MEIPDASSIALTQRPKGGIAGKVRLYGSRHWAKNSLVLVSMISAI